MKRRKNKNNLAYVIIILLMVVVIGIGLGSYFYKKNNDQKKATCSPQRHVNIIVEPSEKVTVKKDICYKNSTQGNNYMDVAFPTESGSNPLIILVHGGSWAGGSREEFKNTMFSLSAAGYTVANIDYDYFKLENLVTDDYETMLSEEESVNDAINYLVQHAEEYHLDPKTVVMAGHSSAGQVVGNLVERIALEPDNYPYSVRGLVLFAGALDIRMLIYNGMAKNSEEDMVLMPFLFAGEAESDLITEINKVDFRSNLTDKLPPVMLVHGTSDPTVPYQISINIYDSLKEIGVTTELVTLEGKGHVLSDQEKGDAIYTFMQTYINSAAKEGE